MANAAERITDVLSLLAKHPYGLSAADVGEALSLSRAAASRLLSLMIDVALVERDPTTQKYVVGLELWVTGAAALQRLPVMELSQLPMAEAVSAHRIPLFIGVNRGAQTYVVRAMDCVRGFPIVNPLALKRPIPELATGKAILAFDTPKNVASALAGLFVSGNEVRRRERFVEELDLTRERGYALKYVDDQSAVNGIAVPIFDRTRYAVAGLSTSLPPVPVEDYTPDPTLSVLKEIAEAISSSLGFVRFTVEAIA